MARFGVFALAWTGHLNPLFALSDELSGRGHEVIFFHVPEFREQIESRGFSFRSYGEGRFPAGIFAQRNQELSRLKGDQGVTQALGTTMMWGEALLQEARSEIESAALDLWLVDYLDYAASILARDMRAPYVTMIGGLMRHSEAGIPGFSGEPHCDSSPADSAQMRLYKVVQPWRDCLDQYSLEAGLGRFSYDTVWSSLAQITQQPAEFEFPRKTLPKCFHFTGPFISKRPREDIDFPWNRLQGLPIVYASLGSLSHGNRGILQAIADAVGELEVQLVLSVGEAEHHLRLPPNTIAVPYAPQLELLKRTDLMIHHSGMNTTLECLAEGVPMIVVPLTAEQPGIARRVEWSGVGIRISPQDCRPGTVRSAVETVLGDERYGRAAGRFQKIIAGRNGLQRAAEIVEHVVRTGQPVLRDS
jgi:zeaxanthin glucosyltransferase